MGTGCGETFDLPGSKGELEVVAIIGTVLQRDPIGDNGMAPEKPVWGRESQVGVSCGIAANERALKVHSEGTCWNVGL